MNNVSVLKSVFYKKSGTNWQQKLFWRNLGYEGRKLVINNELDTVINEDFDTDRYYLSLFLDYKDIWEHFNEAAIETGYDVLVKEDHTDEETLTGWLTDSKEFTIEVLYKLLNQLNFLEDFYSFVRNERIAYHQECCDCGYPLLLPEKIQVLLLHHISWG